MFKEQPQNIARDCYPGDISKFTDTKSQMTLPQCLCPLMLMNPDQTQGMYQNKPHMYYAYMKDAFPWSKWLFLFYGSCCILNKEETELFRKYYKQIEEAIDEISEN